MISAKNAGERATQHMANLIHAEGEDGAWYVDTCQLATFLHDSYWYPEGVSMTIGDDAQLVYRVIVTYAHPGVLTRKKRSMILSIDAHNGELRGYKTIEPPKKNYNGIIAAGITVIAVAVLIVAAVIVLHQHPLFHHATTTSVKG